MHDVEGVCMVNSDCCEKVCSGLICDASAKAKAAA